MSRSESPSTKPSRTRACIFVTSACRVLASASDTSGWRSTCSTDLAREIALVADRKENLDGAHEILGVGRLIKTPGLNPGGIRDSGLRPLARRRARDGAVEVARRHRQEGEGPHFGHVLPGIRRCCTSVGTPASNSTSTRRKTNGKRSWISDRSDERTHNRTVSFAPPVQADFQRIAIGYGAFAEEVLVR